MVSSQVILWNETTYILWVSFQTLLVWPMELLTKHRLFYCWMASSPYMVRYANHTNECLMRSLSDLRLNLLHSHLSTLLVEIFVSRRVSLSLWLAGIWCVPTVQLYSFLPLFQPQWPHPQCYWTSSQEAGRLPHLFYLFWLLHWTQTAAVFPCVLQTVSGATCAKWSPGAITSVPQLLCNHPPPTNWYFGPANCILSLQSPWVPRHPRESQRAAENSVWEVQKVCRNQFLPWLWEVDLCKMHWSPSRVALIAWGYHHWPTGGGCSSTCSSKEKSFVLLQAPHQRAKSLLWDMQRVGMSWLHCSHSSWPPVWPSYRCLPEAQRCACCKSATSWTTARHSDKITATDRHTHPANHRAVGNSCRERPQKP